MKTSRALEAQHLGGDPIPALVDDDRAVLERLPPAMMAARIEAELRRPEPSTTNNAPSWWRRLGMIAAPVAVAAAVVVVVVPSAKTNDPVVSAVQAQNDIRLKGQTPGLDLVQVGDTGPEPLRSGDVVAPGVVVQVQTRAAGARYGVVISVDGRGSLTRHFPDSGAAAATALPSGTAPLPFSFQLDDAPRFERFFLVTSDQPVDVVAVESAGRRLVGEKDPMVDFLPGLPTGLQQTDFLLKKPATPR